MRLVYTPLRLIAVLFLAFALAGPAAQTVIAQDDTAPPDVEQTDAPPEDIEIEIETDTAGETSDTLTEVSDTPSAEDATLENLPTQAADPTAPESSTPDAPEIGAGGETAPDEETPIEATTNSPDGVPPVEVSPVDEPPVDEPPGDEPPGDEPAAEEPPVEVPPTEATPIEATPVEETPTDESPIDQVPVEATPDTFDDKDVFASKTPVRATTTPDATPTKAAANQVQAVANATEDVVIKTVDGSNKPLTGVCYELFRDLGSGVIGPRLRGSCDVSDGSNDGTVHVEDVPTDAFIAHQTLPHSGFLPEPNQTFTTDGKTETPVVLTFVNDQPGKPVSVTLEKVGPTGDPLDGSCFAIFEDADADQGSILLGARVNQLCDLAPGIATVFSFQFFPGTYVAVETEAPPGFDLAADTEFTVVAAQPSAVTISDQPRNFNGNGDLLIRSVNKDDATQQVNGACFEVFANDNGARGTQIGAEFRDDNFSGTVSIVGLPPGDYLLGNCFKLTDFLLLPDQPVTVVANQVIEKTFQFTPQPASGFVMTKEDEEGNPVKGACFEVFTDLDPDPGQIAFGNLVVGGSGVCSDSNGFVLSRNQTDGNYIAVEVVTPLGFASIDAQEFVVNGPNSSVVLVDKKADATTPGKVIITKLALGGTVLPGACFRVFANDGGVRGEPISDEVCDDDDDVNDGRITIGGLLEGGYLLGETDPPSGFLAAADQEFAIVRGQSLRLTIVDLTADSALPSSFTATKVDENGDPLEGACFDFFEDLDEAPGHVTIGDRLAGSDTDCSDETGFILNRLQEAGTYVAVEVTTPIGFAPTVTEFTVGEIGTTNVEIVNHRAGTLTIINLVCQGDKDAVEFAVTGPADSAAAGTIDDCDPGDAEFQISAFGTTGVDPFRVGDDGKSTLVLPETVRDAPHILTETATGASVEVDISPDQVTTVVVRNVKAVNDDVDDADDFPDGPDVVDDDESAGVKPDEIAAAEDPITALPNTGVVGREAGHNHLAPFGLLGLMALAGACFSHRQRTS